MSKYAELKAAYEALDKNTPPRWQGTLTFNISMTPCKPIIWPAVTNSRKLKSSTRTPADSSMI